jgi:hypothetical protein
VPCHHSAVISKTADTAQYNSAVISKNSDVTSLHSAAVSKAADVACCHSAVISKTPASPVTARWLFLKTPTWPVITRLLSLKRRRHHQSLGRYFQSDDVVQKDSAVTSKTLTSQQKKGGRTTRLPPLKILTINQTFFLHEYAGKSKKCDPAILSRYSSVTSKNNGYIKRKHDQREEKRRESKETHTEWGEIFFIIKGKHYQT